MALFVMWVWQWMNSEHCLIKRIFPNKKWDTISCVTFLFLCFASAIILSLEDLLPQSIRFALIANLVIASLGCIKRWFEEYHKSSSGIWGILVATLIMLAVSGWDYYTYNVPVVYQDEFIRFEYPNKWQKQECRWTFYFTNSKCLLALGDKGKIYDFSSKLVTLNFYRTSFAGSDQTIREAISSAIESREEDFWTKVISQDTLDVSGISFIVLDYSDVNLGEQQNYYHTVVFIPINSQELVHVEYLTKDVGAYKQRRQEVIKLIQQIEIAR